MPTSESGPSQIPATVQSNSADCENNEMYATTAVWKTDSLTLRLKVTGVQQEAESLYMRLYMAIEYYLGSSSCPLVEGNGGSGVEETWAYQANRAEGVFSLSGDPLLANHIIDDFASTLSESLDYIGETDG